MCHCPICKSNDLEIQELGTVADYPDNIVRKYRCKVCWFTWQVKPVHRESTAHYINDYDRQISRVPNQDETQGQKDRCDTLQTETFLVETDFGVQHSPESREMAEGKRGSESDRLCAVCDGLPFGGWKDPYEVLDFDIQPITGW